MGKLYDHVHYFATDLASKALAKNPVSGESDIAPTPPSQSELTRIERTLYRFEIYCNVFRGPPNTFLSLRRRWFFFQFSPWENEQMACIYDHFVSVVTPAFEDVSEKDPKWDSDTGPEDIRRWAHQSETSDEFVFSKAQRPLRK
ncbi:hypothetical protein M432DRAFT_638579 [Thermoascus aurantiacus ATCC 26904]